MNRFFKVHLVIFLIITFSISTNSRLYASEFFNSNIECEGLDTVDKYACLTEHAVKGIEYTFAKAKIHLQPDEISILKAIETMELVQNIASSGRYLYKKYNSNFSPPSMLNQDLCLSQYFGICGNHQFLFIEILKRIGVKARSVDFYYSINNKKFSHAAAEIKTKNQWVYFDITWGSIWADQPNNYFKLKSIHDILKGKGNRITSINSWHVAQIQLHQDMFSYLTAKDMQLLIDKGGIIVVKFFNNAVDFSHRPNYFGKTLEHPPLKIKIVGLANTKRAFIHLSKIGGKCNSSFMRVGSKRYPIIKGEIEVSLSPNAIIEVEGKDNLCYPVIGSIKSHSKLS